MNNMLVNIFLFGLLDHVNQFRLADMPLVSRVLEKGHVAELAKQQLEVMFAENKGRDFSHQTLLDCGKGL